MFKITETFKKDNALNLVDLLNEYNVKKCYYGHIHGSNMIKGCINGEYKGIDFHLISCDGVGFMPQLVR